MGSYLKFDGKENNSKSISFPMADLIRGCVKMKEIKSSWISEDEDGFIISRKGLAMLVLHLPYMIEDNEEWCKENIYQYTDAASFKGTFELIHELMVDSLCKMILLDNKHIELIWEG